jgi:hypothetical protein
MATMLVALAGWTDEHIDIYLDKKDRVDGIFIKVEIQ